MVVSAGMSVCGCVPCKRPLRLINTRLLTSLSRKRKRKDRELINECRPSPSCSNAFRVRPGFVNKRFIANSNPPHSFLWSSRISNIGKDVIKLSSRRKWGYHLETLVAHVKLCIEAVIRTPFTSIHWFLCYSAHVTTPSTCVEQKTK